MTLFAVLFSFCFALFLLFFFQLCLALFFGCVYLLMYQLYLLLLLSLLLLFSVLLLLLLLWLYNAQWLNLTVDNISRCQPFECVNVPCLMLRSISICCRCLLLLLSFVVVIVTVVFVVVCRVCISYKLTIQLAFYNTNTHTTWTCQTYRHWPEVCVCVRECVVCVCVYACVS